MNAIIELIVKAIVEIVVAILANRCGDCSPK